MSRATTPRAPASHASLAERGLIGVDARLAVFLLMAAADLGAIWAGCLVAFDMATRTDAVVQGFVILGTAYLVVAGLSGAYSRPSLVSPAMSALWGVRAVVSASASVWIAAVLLGHWDPASIGDTALAVAVSAVLLAAGRIALAFLARLFAGRLSSDLLIIDDVEPVEKPQHYAVMRAANIGLSEKSGANPVGVARLARLGARADRVLVSCSPGRRRFWADLFDPLGLDAGVIVEDVARIAAYDSEFETTLPVLRIARGPLAMRQRILKRMFDLALAVPLFVVLTPLFAALWIALAVFTGKRRILERRTFLGMRNEPYPSHVFIAPGRPALARVLRSSGLDRLPLLLDVVLGHMSLVGPAPVEPGNAAGDAPKRRNVKPGLFPPSTQGSGKSYREGWTLWRDIGSLVRAGTDRNAPEPDA